MPPDPLKNKRIFVGFNSAGSAGIFAYTRILKRRGYQINFYGIGKKAFNMPVDFLFDFSGSRLTSLLKRIRHFLKLLPCYDIWHFNFLECFFFYPINLIILKLFGKKIVLTFRGAEARDRIDFLPKDIFLKKEIIQWPSFYQKQIQRKSWWQRCKQQIRIKIFVFFADQVVLTGPFLASAVPRYDKIIPYAREIEFLKKFKKTQKKLKILHVPSQPLVKGTEIIKKTFRKLQKKYPKFEFKILASIPRQVLLQEMAEADIVIDQLLIGWYGGQAVEAMAMGKIVMAYLHPPYLELVPFGREIPIWNTNAWTFEEDLTTLLEVFPAIQKQWAKKAVTFAQKYHCSAKIAQEYLEVYRRCL